MYWVEEKETDIFKKGYQNTKNKKLLDSFLDANIAVAKLIPDADEYASLDSLFNSICKSIRQFHYDHISLKMRGGDVYLVNTLLITPEVGPII